MGRKIENDLKVLPLPRFFRDAVEEGLPTYTVGKPLVGRDGYYLNRKTGQVWYEFQGTAYFGP